MLNLLVKSKILIFKYNILQMAIKQKCAFYNYGINI